MKNYEEEAMEAAVEEGIVSKVPTKFDVCPTCQGHGSHSQHLGAFTSEEWHREDQEFREDYMSGQYDRMCEGCHGQRVVEVLDTHRASPELQKWIESYIEAAYSVDAIHAQEMRYHA